MNCQTVAFLLEKIHLSLLICNEFSLGCSGVVLLLSNKRQWGQKWDVNSIFIPQLQRGLMQFWNCD